MKNRIPVRSCFRFNPPRSVRWDRISALGITTICLLSPLSIDAASEAPDVLKQQIVAQARGIGPDEYAFTRTVRTEETDGTKTEHHVLIDRWDPSKPADQRWTLVSMDGRSPNADELNNFRKSLPNRRVATYGRVAIYFGAPATIATDAQGRTTYSFPALPKDTVVINGADISANARGEAIVNTSGPVAFVEQSRFTSTKPTRVKLVAVIERMEATPRYRLMPNGKPAPVEQITDVTGSMLGKEGRIHTVVGYTDHRALR